MLRSLVGSEMCIRDRCSVGTKWRVSAARWVTSSGGRPHSKNKDCTHWAGVSRSGEPVSVSRLKLFGSEAEFGMVMKEVPCRDGEYSEEEVWRHVERVELCIELCGCRQAASTHRLHYVADGLLGAGVVRGPALPTQGLDPGTLARVKVSLSIAGRTISTGTALNNPTGSPLGSLTYLVNQLCVKRNTPIQAGELVMCGHCCQAGFNNRPKPPFMNIPRRTNPSPTLTLHHDTLTLTSIMIH
eukprot:TRINITY_DN17679_c0_g1_i2.p1 TRINITY_DN17679_c0_g1~~TRINITY_DN17679_c0_g1_i2.p1  ORF type:complete len:242 (+),score=50.91 TRINITY_DN17679_c0_g1_i2:114-839(+)